MTVAKAIRLADYFYKTAVDVYAEAVLVDDDEARIYNPNTALMTTQFMSILFAISKLSAQKKEKKYPLIFDAPTSSFATVKESEFFDVISKLDKQVIIVTKSFLKEDENGNTVVDRIRLSLKWCSVPNREDEAV